MLTKPSMTESVTIMLTLDMGNTEHSISVMLTLGKRIADLGAGRQQPAGAEKQANPGV